MNKPTAKTALLLAAALMTAGGAQTGFADGRWHGKHHGRSHHGYTHHRHDGRWYRPRDSDDDEKLIYGLLVGGLFGYVLGNNRYDAAPAPVYTPPETSYRSAPLASTCLQEREYQMTVIVGGKEAQAYGTACLQPDGSWYRGPAKVVSR